MADVDRDTEWVDSATDRQQIPGVNRRRRLLELLLSEERHTLTSIARRLADDATDAEAAGQATFRTMYLTLYHEDVPALTAADLVRYDAETGELVPTDGGRAVCRRLADAP